MAKPNNLLAFLQAKMPPLFRGGISLLVWLMALVLIAQVFFRYVLNNSLYWSEEFARYVLIFLVFSAGVFHVWNASLTAFSSQDVGRPKSLLFRLTGAAPNLIFFGFFSYSAYLMIGRAMSQNSVALGVPMWVIYAPLLFFGLAGTSITLWHLLHPSTTASNSSREK